MLAWLVVAQIATVDSLYESAQLKAFVAEASRRNRVVPAGLQSYRASVESEIAIVARRAEGMEGVVSLEQIHNDVRWRAPGTYEQYVVGYRSQAQAQVFTAFGFMRQPWTVPILYGNRLSILFGRDTSRATLRRNARRGITAVHPLADDRDAVYRFRGGDTAQTIGVGATSLPIVRVFVEPRADAPPRTVAFRGELDIDATRHHLVRMRGYFVTIEPPRASILARALTVGGFEAIAFIEFENAEFEGQYWLPRYQRFDAQAAWTSATDARSVFRIVSRYRAHQVNDTTLQLSTDSLVPSPYSLARAPADSLARFSAWRDDIGGLTGAVHSDDFDDIAPDAWRPTGQPRTDLRVHRVSDALHINRIEGFYTGWGIERRFRDDLPGLSLSANAGWAWSERTARGRVSAVLERGPWTSAVRAGRSLDITNDFRSVFDSGSTLAALFGQDDYDYVDRRLAALAIRRRLRRVDAIWSLETGPARDAPVSRHLSRGLFRGDSGFRENRGVDAGTYWRGWTALQWHPDVNAEFMRTGVGGLLSAELAAGDLSFTRLEARLVARKNRGRLTVAGRADAGAVLGDSVPPQQLFEVGRGQNLQGYGYKEFVGDRGAVARGLVMLRLPLFESPIPIGRALIPGLTPALAVGVQSAWTKLSTEGSRAANARLATRIYAPPSRPPDPPALPIVVPVGQPTDGVRTSLTLGMRFFGGALGVGAARPLDRRGPWKLRIDFGQAI